MEKHRLEDPAGALFRQLFFEEEPPLSLEPELELPLMLDPLPPEPEPEPDPELRFFRHSSNSLSNFFWRSSLNILKSSSWDCICRSRQLW